MKLKFELNETKFAAKDVLEYLFDAGEYLTVDAYFEKVKNYLQSILESAKLSPENLIVPYLKNKETCKRIFNTVLLMMHLPLSLECKLCTYKINAEIDFSDSDPRSVLYTAIHDVEDFIERIPEEYFISPASAKYHGAFSGGLMYHSLGVLKSVLDTCDVYLTDKFNIKYPNTKHIVVEIRHYICANLPAILLHDFCKVGKYKFIEDKKKYEYNNDAEPAFQHGAESYRRIVHEGFHISKEWELAVVYHMGVFDVSKQEMIDFSSISEKVPEVLLLHHADMISSKILHI